MEQLGIEPSLLLAQIVNFSIIIIVLTRLLYKPILKALEDRRTKIEEGLALTAKMQAAEARMKEKEEKLLDDTREEVRKIISDAKAQGKREKDVIVAEARSEAEAIMKKAKSEIVQARQAMEASVRNDAVNLAASMTRQLLGDIIGVKDQEKLLGEHIKRLERTRVN